MNNETVHVKHVDGSSGAVRALAGVVVGKTLCSHNASLHIGVKMGNSEFNAGVNPTMGLHPVQRGVAIILAVSCYRNRDKRWPDGPQEKTISMKI